MIKTKRKSKPKTMLFLSEEALQYMNNVWGFDTASESDDMAMFWECGEEEMVALRLVEAGAVEPNCKEAKEIIKVAKSISLKQSRAIADKCLKFFKVAECSKCNGIRFVSPYCNVSDWTDGECKSCGVKGNVKEVTK
jgi:hypothetical protein